MGKNGTPYRDAKLEKMPKKDLLKLQSKKLRRQVQYVYQNSKLHQQKFDEKKVKPEDIKIVDDISKLPIITRDDIQKLITQDDPWGGRLCAPQEEVVVENAPPEMGIVDEPILGLLTFKDRRNLIEQLVREFIMIGVEKGEVFQMQAWLWEPISLMCTVSAHSFFLGPTVSEILNLIPIPLELIGPDQPRSVHVAIHLKPKTIFTQPATLDAMAENAKTRNIDPKKLGYRTMVFRARYPEDKNMLSAEQAENYKKIWGAEPFAMLDIVDNLLYAADCPEHMGIHVWQDAFVVEAIDPKTMEPVGPGERGRLVISNIFAEGVPLLRYMVEIEDVVLEEEACPCGRTHTRIITPGYMK